MTISLVFVALSPICKLHGVERFQTIANGSFDNMQHTVTKHAALFLTVQVNHPVTRMRSRPRRRSEINSSTSSQMSFKRSSTPNLVTGLHYRRYDKWHFTTCIVFLSLCLCTTVVNKCKVDLISVFCKSSCIFTFKTLQSVSELKTFLSE